jgi:hypothetical protein
MAQDDYFSFGDEDFESELGLGDLREDFPGQALALAEPPEPAPIGEDGFESAAKRAARPRGDSENGSSERRLPSSRRTRVFAALALGLLALFLVRIGVSALGGGEPSDRSQASATEARSAAPSAAVLEARRRTAALRASRERAAERQRARQHRAQTRHRARRRRQRAGAERHQNAKQRREREAAQEEAAATAEAPAPEDVPPTYEPAPPPSTPAPEPDPAPPSEGHIQNGASSPEFGL